MKANEFVKKFGLSEAKKILNPKGIYLDLAYLARKEHGLNINDLKRLVESHELVGKFGGLKEAKEYLDERHIFTWDALDVQLKQAILDVEQCQ